MEGIHTEGMMSAKTPRCGSASVGYVKFERPITYSSGNVRTAGKNSTLLDLGRSRFVGGGSRRQRGTEVEFNLD